jgi:hypothetical protein
MSWPSARSIWPRTSRRAWSRQDGIRRVAAPYTIACRRICPMCRPLAVSTGERGTAAPYERYRLGGTSAQPGIRRDQDLPRKDRPGRGRGAACSPYRAGRGSRRTAQRRLGRAAAALRPVELDRDRADRRAQSTGPSYAGSARGECSAPVRVAIGGVRLGGLAKGKIRPLGPGEIARSQHHARDHLRLLRVAKLDVMRDTPGSRDSTSR